MYVLRLGLIVPVSPPVVLFAGINIAWAISEAIRPILRADHAAFWILQL